MKLSNLNKYILLIGVFFIPIHIQLFTYSCILFILFSLLNFKFNFNSIKQSVLNKWYVIFPLIVYYLYDAIGLLWTNNIQSGLFDLEVKLALFLIPFIILIYTKNFSVQSLLMSFIAGCLSASIILIINVAIYYFKTKELLTYSEFSLFHHTSYFTWYLNCASLGLLLINTAALTIPRKLIIIFILFFTSLLCLSKIGIFTSSITIVYIIFFTLKQYSSKWKLPLLISGLSLIGIIFFLIFNHIKTRFIETKNLIENLSTHSHQNITYLESNTMRVIAWSSSVDIIKTNFWIGTGTGDFKDEIVKRYNASHYKLLVEKRLNSHNQFLQDFAKLGVINFILLISVFVISFLKVQSPISRIIIIITFINFCFESMLETQAGTIFFAFILSTLLFIQDSYFCAFVKNK